MQPANSPYDNTCCRHPPTSSILCADPSESVFFNCAPPASIMTHTRTVTHCADNQTRHTEEFLNAKADTFMDHVNAYQISLSSLLRFPPELLAEIFMAVVKRGPAREHPDLEKKSCSPALTLLHVCSRWRRVAIDTLQLWSDIQINLKHKPEGLLSLLKQYMTWSKQAPLHLTIVYENKPETWNQVLDIIVPQAHRWEHIKFHLLDRDFQFGLALAKSHLHSLKALQLSFYYPERCTVDVYECASHLITLTLEGVVSPDLIKLPWTQIEELEFSEFTIALHAIKFSKNLLSCHLYMDIFALIPPSRGTPALICNSNLKVLEVTCLTIDEGSISQFSTSSPSPPSRP